MRHGLASLFLGGVMMITALPVVAGGPAPFPQFEPRRVAPPAAGTRKRITVQIDPARMIRRPDAKPIDKGAEPVPVARDTGFWDAISPALAHSGPGRLKPALRALTSGGPRLQALQDIARQRGRDILRATVGTRVSPALVLAVIAVESSGRADAVSPAGAAGLMQLMPATAARFGVTDRHVAPQNIAGGVKYLDWLMGRFDADPILVLAGYNAGEGAVQRHKGVPPFAETRDYVPRVLAAFQVARGLCLTPPELISDGCVFTALN